jgi:DNA-binding IclR family transcriptional regulator
VTSAASNGPPGGIDPVPIAVAAQRRERDPAAVQSVDRALTVLEILAQRGIAGVTDIAGELGVHKSTASRLVAVLESRGFVEQLSERGKYRLGFGIARLAGALTVHRDLAHAGRAASEALAAELGETVNLAIADGARVINIGEVRGPGAVAVQNWVGQSTPLHATSSGKALIAHLAQPDRDALLGPELQRYTEYTITDPGQLARELDAVRERGWASTVEEYELGLNALAAPVRDHDGSVVAAISVAGPSFRLVRDDFPDVAARVLQAAEEFEHRLGNFS